MKVVFASNRGMSRQRLLSYVAEQKAQRSKFSVVDIGGAINPWSAEVADCYVDMHETAGHETICGDIHDLALWQEIGRRNFDFVICSHILEDVRDPLFVLSRLQETFAHGYIAMPSKHVEFSHIESKHYVGYGHHRWIYTLADGELRVIAKLPFASYYSPKRESYLAVLASQPLSVLRSALGIATRTRHEGPLHWWRKQLGGPGNELAFVWQGRLQFRAINSDFSGMSIRELARLYREELAGGL
jgi:hypothetical protein